MGRWCCLLGATAIAACGGKSGKQDVAEAGGMPGAGNGGMAQVSAGGGGMAQAGGGGTTTYVPTNPLVSPQGDGSLTGGSFEGSLGDGWDLCGNTRREFWLQRESDDASDGEQFIVFDSSRPCPSSAVCTSAAGDLPLILWPSENLPTGELKHLYFDSVNLATTAASGMLRLAAPGAMPTDLCRGNADLASIPLANLALTSTWETRCVTFEPIEPVYAFGFYVTGDDFKVGLDTFRFGPPCQE